MDQPLNWLEDATGTPWSSLAEAHRSGLPVPNGFVAGRLDPEESIRAAYEQLKIRERTHFAAVRGPSHAVLDTLGPDALIHAMRRLWMEAPDAILLVQRMVNAVWCGKADWIGKSAGRILQIKANEGMLILNPDVYTFNTATGKCTKKTIQQKQRRMIRRVDGVSRTIETQNERTPLGIDRLKQIAELAGRVGSGIGWAIDDNSRLWLISVNA